MVDYAMKLYISADMHEPSATTLNTLITSELAWAIVLAGRSCAAKRIRENDALPVTEKTRKPELYNFVALTYTLSGIRERFDITIQQEIFMPLVRLELIRAVALHERFAHSRNAFVAVLKRVYGDRSVDRGTNRQSIPVRNWVFFHN
jgi:hypothetical protein